MEGKVKDLSKYRYFSIETVFDRFKGYLRQKQY